jgi:large repetitive protein
MKPIHWGLLLAAMLPILSNAATITGTVVLEDTTTAIAGAEIILRQGQQNRDTTTSGEDGAFTFTDVAPGNYTVQSTKTGYVTETANASLADSAAIDTVNLEMAIVPPPGLVRGTVVDTVGDQPVAGARVILSRGNSTTGFRDTVLTDAQGAFGFDSVPANSGYSIAVSAIGFVNRTLNNQTIPGGDTLIVEVGIAPPLPPGLVRGTVVDTVSDQPVSGARVILSRFGGGGSFADTVITNAQGAFGFDSVPANSGYSIAVSATGYVNRTLSNQTVPGGDTLIVEVGIALIPPPGLVRGTVVDTVSDEPVSGARVILSRGGGGGGFADTVTTNAQGAFGFDSVPANSGYSIAVSATGFVNRTLNNQTIPGGDTLIVEVGVSPVMLGTLSIFVAIDSADSVALKGASVVARINNNNAFTGTTGDNGWVTFDSVAQGSYTVTISLAGFVSEATTRSVSNGENDTGRVYLARATETNSKSLSGVVRDSAGAAVEGATVVLVLGGGGGGGGSLRLQVTTSATGEYSITGIPSTATTGTLTVTKTGLTMTPATVPLTSATNTYNAVMRVPTSLMFGLKARVMQVNAARKTGLLMHEGKWRQVNGRALMLR